MNNSDLKKRPAYHFIILNFEEILSQMFGYFDFINMTNIYLKYTQAKENCHFCIPLLVAAIKL